MIDYLGFGYALMVAGGGVMGYVQAKSIPSLTAGLIFGSVIGFGAYQVSAHNRVSVSLVTSAALGGMMGYKFYGSGKIMPAGLIAAMRLSQVISLGGMMDWRFYGSGKIVSAGFIAAMRLSQVIIFGGVMGWRFCGSGKIMSAGFIAAMSFLFVIYYIVLGVLFYKGILGDSPYERTPQDALPDLARNGTTANLMRNETTTTVPA